MKAITAYVYETFLENIDMDFAKREGLLFVGGFAHPPNADAVLWFAKEVFPLIREKLDVTFYVVGSKVTEEIRALEQPGSGIVVKGIITRRDKYTVTLQHEATGDNAEQGDQEIFYKHAIESVLIKNAA